MFDKHACRAAAVKRRSRWAAANPHLFAPVLARSYEIDKLTASQRLDLNLEKGRMRDELQSLRDKTNELEIKASLLSARSTGWLALSAGWLAGYGNANVPPCRFLWLLLTRSMRHS